MNPARAPEVVGALLDAEAPDDFVNNLILSVRSLIPVERLCAEVEKRNRLKLLSPFLEHLVSEGSQVRCVRPDTCCQLIVQVLRRACWWCIQRPECSKRLWFCRIRMSTMHWARSSSTRKTTRTIF